MIVSALPAPDTARLDAVWALPKLLANPGPTESRNEPSLSAHRRHPRRIGEIPVHDHRPDELTRQPIRHIPPTGLAPAPVRERNETITDNRLARQIDELEQHLRRDDPALAQQFNRLDRAHTRIEVTVFLLLVAAAVLLAIALAATSPVAGVGGIVAYVAAFGVDDHHRRKLGRRSTSQGGAPVAVTSDQFSPPSVRPILDVRPGPMFR